FAVISLMFFLGLLSFLFLKASSALREFIYYFSTIEHMGEFSRGLFDTRPIVFYLSMTLFTLFLTFHVFQYRRWKSYAFRAKRSGLPSVCKSWRCWCSC